MEGLSFEKSLIMDCGSEQTPEEKQHFSSQPDGNCSLVLVPKQEFFKAQLVQERERGDGGRARRVMGESWRTHHQNQLGNGKDVEGIL